MPDTGALPASNVPILLNAGAATAYTMPVEYWQENTMRIAVIAAMAATALGTVANVQTASAGSVGLHTVVGVENDDMLKMRAGPGTGFKVLLGLPNGTVLRLHGCDQTGGTRWCKASLKQSRRVKGYVSWAYLQKM